MSISIAYRRLSLASAVLFGTLCIVLLVRPQIVFVLFGLESGASTIVLARRAAMLFLGLATVAWVSRDSKPNIARSAISRGMAVCLFALAGLGTLEFVLGGVSAGVFVAVATELAFAAAYTLVDRSR